MSKVIEVKRVIVSPDGSEYDNAAAFRRHADQSKRGAARSTVSIKRAGEPLLRAALSEGDE